MKIELLQVQYMPKVLEPGVLYVSTEFGSAAHLCACGCGEKVRTPLGPSEWALEETAEGPTLTPSIGNWQQACQSHYWIVRGQIIWGERWTTDEIAAGRTREEERRRDYYASRAQPKQPLLTRLWRWLKRRLG